MALSTPKLELSGNHLTNNFGHGEGFDLDRDIVRLTFAQLKREVQKYAAALRAAGVGKGDRVAGYMPNCVETCVAMLATATVGAVWSSTSVDFGHMGVLDRFGQIAPKVLFSVEAVVYKGKPFDHMAKLEKVVRELPSLKAVVLCPFVSAEADVDLSSLGPNAIYLSQFLKNGQNAAGDFDPLAFEQVPFDHPLFIMFSSGTTGAPKAMVHSVGGTLLKHLEEHVIQEDMTEKDTIFFWTTCGWMMWNWLMTSLATGASVVLYDGSPFEPRPSVLFDVAEKTGTSIIGMGAKCYDVYEQKQMNFKESHNLNALRMVLSTGSPLKPACFDYVYKNVKDDLLIGSICGGTDIIACFMGVGIKHPVYRGEIQCLYLGMNMAAWNEKQEAVLCERGELICLTPFPSQPTHFLDDPDGSRYRKAYFDKYPGVWAHGDFCILNDKTGGVIMLGRSDGTLNPGGVRFGSAELYHVVEAFEEIEDSVVVGQKLPDDDERVVMFVKMNNGFELDATLLKKLKTTIRTSMSPKHVPSVFLVVPDIPYTTSGKKVEIAVKQILAGDEVKNANALRNPEVLDLFRQLRSHSDLQFA
uniref:Acetoacetyl-CoA synthetase n=1 Tax=Plectus sambesii TaxID=2011161 RepID=A0A914UL04_9BILA